MTTPTYQDIDETARLVLMSDARVGYMAFAEAMRDEHPGIPLAPIYDLWGKYRGWDGRTLPTHDIETGARL